MSIIARAFNYYKDFKCKCSNCRNTCCKYWNIAIGLDEYLKFVGLDCDSEMRKKLDVSFSIVPHTTPNRYATINLDLDGNCLLLDNKGLCGLQKSLGIKNIPSVCNQYPRQVRENDLSREFSMTNSCEEVIELLYSYDKPIFLEEVNSNDSNLIVSKNLLSTEEVSFRNEIISIFQSAGSNIETKFSKINNLFYKYDQSVGFLNFNEVFFMKLIELTEVTLGKSIFLMEYENNVLKMFNNTKGYSLFLEKSNEFFRENSKYELWLENILINHIFYANFPFLDKRESFYITGFSLQFVYKYILIMVLANKGTTLESIVDIIAFCFRKIEHSNFYYNIGVIITEVLEENKEKTYA